jgi:hypothetical protein
LIEGSTFTAVGFFAAAFPVGRALRFLGVDEAAIMMNTIYLCINKIY